MRSRTHLNGLLQHPAADGADQVFVHVPLKTRYIIPHCSSPGPGPCGGTRDKGQGSGAAAVSAQRGGHRLLLLLLKPDLELCP